MWTRTGLVVSVLLGLACGGGGLGGSSVGPYATSMAEYQEKENPGIPCPTFAVGDEVKLADWTLRIDAATVQQGEDSLPWISNSDERRAFAKDGVQALAIEYSVRNDTPVKKRRDFGMAVTTTDGEKARWWAYNEHLYLADHGLEESPDDYPPGTWVKTAGITSANGAFVDGAVVRLYYETEEFDPSDPRGRRKIDVLHEQAIVDLGTPTPGPHINPEKR